MKKAVILLSTLLFLTGCTSVITAEKEEYDGITAETKLSSENKKNGNTLFRLETDFLNTSESLSLMEIRYVVTGKDSAGDEVFMIHDSWNGQDTPLDPGQTAKASFGFQQKTGKEVKTLEVSTDNTLTANEMPPVHIPKPGEYVYEVHQDPYIRNIKKDLPVKIDIIIDHMGMQETAEITDPEVIQQITDAFTKITIGKETEEYVTDNYNSVTFTFDDGSAVCISLNLMNLEYSVNGRQHLYILDNIAEFRDMIYDLAEYPFN